MVRCIDMMICCEYGMWVSRLTMHICWILDLSNVDLDAVLSRGFLNVP